MAKKEEQGEDGTTFDERLQKLEGIVGDLEQGELGLEEAIGRYQQGVEELKRCLGILSGYRQRVEELTADAEASLRPYRGDPDAPQAGAGDGA